MSGVPTGRSLERRTEISTPPPPGDENWTVLSTASSGKLRSSENANATSAGRLSCHRTPVQTDPFGKENRVRGLNLKRGSA